MVMTITTARMTTTRTTITGRITQLRDLIEARSFRKDIKDISNNNDDDDDDDDDNDDDYDDKKEDDDDNLFRISFLGRSSARARFDKN